MLNTFRAEHRDFLRSWQYGGRRRKISTGFHAVEFLLWGQDEYVDGPGQRSVLTLSTPPMQSVAANIWP